MKIFLKNMMMVALTIIISSTVAKAQLEMQGSQFILDKTFINPAFMGTESQAMGNAQYQAVSGAQGSGAKAYTLSVGGNVNLPKVKSSIGFNAVKNTFGNDSYTVGYGNYVYHLPVSENMVLSSSIGIGVQQFDINLSDLVTVKDGDPLARRNIYSSKFDARFGIAGRINNKYYFGLSFDNILSLYTNKDSYSNQVPATFRKINLYAIMGANLPIQGNLMLTPTFLFIKNMGGITSIDVNAQILMNRSLAFGIGFRQRIEEVSTITEDNGRSLTQSIIRPMLSYQLNNAKNSIKIGYLYNFNASSSVGLNVGTHDISLAFIIP
ncbi:PorP/SprF family type IX secretion system membrane protein [Pedobacter changchengzhani]|nr:PorP/SprF family type IX secretion system membrane protein [Pedobacter changchengzhani]